MLQELAQPVGLPAEGVEGGQAAASGCMSQKCILHLGLEQEQGCSAGSKVMAASCLKNTIIRWGFRHNDVGLSRP